MRIIAILGFFILQTVQVMGQLSSERTFGNKILTTQGINRECYAFVETPQGIVISSRTETNVPMNYLYTDKNEVKIVELLNGYIVCQYSPVRNDLLVTKYQYGNSDSMSHEVYTFNLSTHKFTKQCDFGWIYGEPKFNSTFDSVSVVVNEKNSDGVGSHACTKTVKLK